MKEKALSCAGLRDLRLTFSPAWLRNFVATCGLARPTAAYGGLRWRLWGLCDAAYHTVDRAFPVTAACNALPSKATAAAASLASLYEKPKTFLFSRSATHDFFTANYSVLSSTIPVSVFSCVLDSCGLYPYRGLEMVYCTSRKPWCFDDDDDYDDAVPD